MLQINELLPDPTKSWLSKLTGVIHQSIDNLVYQRWRFNSFLFQQPEAGHFNVNWLFPSKQRAGCWGIQSRSRTACRAHRSSEEAVSDRERDRKESVTEGSFGGRGHLRKRSTSQEGPQSGCRASALALASPSAQQARCAVATSPCTATLTRKQFVIHTVPCQGALRNFPIRGMRWLPAFWQI